MICIAIEVLLVGMFILISGGMQMMENSVIYPKPPFVQRAGWFAGVIIGSFLGALGNYFTSKKVLFVSIELIYVTANNCHSFQVAYSSL